jgi:restriction system protein
MILYEEDALVTRAWTVRGGETGEREQAALDQGLIILGWDELDEDLSKAASPGDLTTLVRQAYPTDGPRTIDNWSYQLWQFIRVMAIGDLVVMPRKYKSVVAIGRVTGEYEYRSEAPAELRHVRKVTWLKRNVERAALKGDLRDSMGSFRTVSELSRRDAAKRVQSLVDSGTDPGYEGDVPPPASQEELKADVHNDGTRQLSARDLIALWGWQRRTSDCIDVVNNGLNGLGLVVEPHFTAVQLDDLITVSSAADREPEPDEGIGEIALAALTVQSSGDGGNRTDLSWRVGSLSLSKKVVTVSAQQRVGIAVERMVAGEYSQLPVVDEYRRLQGVITWESIAHAQFTRRPDLVADAMLTDPYSCRESDELFPHIDNIQRYGFLIIVDGENVVTGILTAADLSGELRNRVQPFTVLEEIERRLRRAISPLSLDELRASFPDGDSRAKNIKSPESLTLGNYSFLLDDEQRWRKLGWPYERTDMVDRLRKVAAYRNAIAHWDIDAPGQGSDELTHAIEVLRLLKVIDRDPSR